MAGVRRGALERGTAGDHPDIAYSWYVAWLEWLRDTGHTFFGPLVAVGEVVIGICLILGLFTGIMAFLGAILNCSFVFAGSAGVNPSHDRGLRDADPGLAQRRLVRPGPVRAPDWALPQLGASCSTGGDKGSRVMTTWPTRPQARRTPRHPPRSFGIRPRPTGRCPRPPTGPGAGPLDPRDGLAEGPE